MSDAHDTPAHRVHPETPSADTPLEPNPPTLPTKVATTDASASGSAPVQPPTHPNIALGDAAVQIDLLAGATGNTAPTPTTTGNDQIDPVLLALTSAQEQHRDGDQDEDAVGELDIDLDEEGFDPDTLANLAALSRIAHEEDDEGPEEEAAAAEAAPVPRQGDPQQAGPSQPPAVARESKEQDKIREDLETPQKVSKEDTKTKRKREYREKESRSQSVAPARSSGDEESDEEELREKSDSEGKNDEDRFYYLNGKLRRKRNRTVLSCTECHRRKQHCDRNIPCNRCIRRGVPGMCRMEAPILPERKRRRPLEEAPINYELGLRVQALESLIRAGTTMDADTANSAAMETILQATKAAGKGNVEAGNALAHLSSAAGMDMSEMESEERAELLMEVLQQLSAATVPKPADNEAALDSTDDPWSTVPRARTNMLSNQPVNTLLESDANNPQLDLTLHGFREDNGRIFIPPTVRYVEKRMRAEQESVLARDALPIQGDEKFLSEGTKLAYGAESPAWRKGLISAVQAHTITGALRIAANFLSRFPSSSTAGPRTVYVPTPTTVEDETALRNSGLEVRRFRFLDTETGVVDWEGAREDLMTAGPKSVVLVYVSGTIPTGVELNPSQWRLLTSVLLERQLLPLCVMPFQGLATGDPERDSQPVKFMVHEGLPVVLVQSFDAAMGIYADSPTIVSIATQSTETKERVDSQLRASARNFHSHPAPWGAQIVHAILSDSKLYPAWLNELKAMSDRLKSVREKLYDVITTKLKTPGTWYHIKRSLGMQCTSLLIPSQVSSLALTRNIHLNPDGTFSLGALNAHRIELLARGIDSIVRQSIREQEEAQAAKIAMEQALAVARETAAREEAEAAERAAREAEEKAREEDTLLMEASIADAIEQQRKEEEEEKRREEERREMDEAIRKAAERADIARRAEEILASIGSI